MYKARKRLKEILGHEEITHRRSGPSKRIMNYRAANRTTPWIGQSSPQSRNPIRRKSRTASSKKPAAFTPSRLPRHRFMGSWSMDLAILASAVPVIAAACVIIFLLLSHGNCRLGGRGQDNQSREMDPPNRQF